MPSNNTYISADSPIAEENSNVFSRVWFMFFSLVSKKIAIIDGNFVTTATAGTAAALPATPQGYMTIIDNQGVTRKVPYYNA